MERCIECEMEGPELMFSASMCVSDGNGSADQA